MRGIEVKSKYIGKKIIEARLDLDKDLVFIAFEDGIKIIIWDDMRSDASPQTRYISCDDNVESIVGYTLLDIIEKDGQEITEDDWCHETMFIEIKTDGGSITLVNHTEHNGYYGGFDIAIEEVKEIGSFYVPIWAGNPNDDR